MRQRRRLAVHGGLVPRAHRVAPVPLRGRRDAAGAPLRRGGAPGAGRGHRVRLGAAALRRRPAPALAFFLSGLVLSGRVAWRVGASETGV